MENNSEKTEEKDLTNVSLSVLEERLKSLYKEKDNWEMYNTFGKTLSKEKLNEMKILKKEIRKRTKAETTNKLSEIPFFKHLFKK